QVIRPDVVKRADVGMIERRYRACLALEPLAELFAYHLNRDSAAETRVHRPKDLPHTAFAEFAFDTVGAEACTRNGGGNGCIGEKFRGVQDGRAIEEFATGAVAKKRLYLAAQFGIGLFQQCRPLLSGGVAGGVIEFFDLPEMLGIHGQFPDVFSAVW